MGAWRPGDPAERLLAHLDRLGEQEEVPEERTKLQRARAAMSDLTTDVLPQGDRGVRQGLNQAAARARTLAAAANDVYGRSVQAGRSTMQRPTTCREPFTISVDVTTAVAENTPGSWMRASTRSNTALRTCSATTASFETSSRGPSHVMVLAWYASCSSTGAGSWERR